MTKFKEYLRAKGIKLECDYEYSEYIEYIDFLRDMGYIDSGWALTVMRNTYEDHAKVRIAFKHMKAGIMDAKAFCKLAFRYCFY